MQLAPTLQQCLRVLNMSDIDSSPPCRPRVHQVKLIATADDLGERLLQFATYDPWCPPQTEMLPIRAESTTLRTAENRRFSEACYVTAQCPSMDGWSLRMMTSVHIDGDQ